MKMMVQHRHATHAVTAQPRCGHDTTVTARSRRTGWIWRRGGGGGGRAGTDDDGVAQARDVRLPGACEGGEPGRPLPHGLHPRLPVRLRACARGPRRGRSRPGGRRECVELRAGAAVYRNKVKAGGNRAIGEHRRFGCGVRVISGERHGQQSSLRERWHCHPAQTDQSLHRVLRGL